MKIKYLKYLLLLLFLPMKIFGQSICEPILVIDASHLNRVFEARFDDCFDNTDLVQALDDPEIRANVLSKYKIKSVKKVTKTKITVESFDENGYLDSFTEYNQDTILYKVKYINSFNENSKLIKSYSQRSNSNKIISLYQYDKTDNLIQYSRIIKRGFLKYKFSRTYKYDTTGNLVEISGLKRFDYDNKNRLILATDINIYAGRSYPKWKFWKKKAIYANRQFKEFLYNADDNLRLIRFCHFDSVTFKNYKMIFNYNSSKQLTKIIKYHGNGRPWKIQEFEYSNNLLIAEHETMCSGTSSDCYTIVKKYFYKNGLIYKIEEYYSNGEIKNRKNGETNFEYTFY